MTRGTPVPETATLHVPFRVVKRGGRKEMRLPDGATPPRRTDSTLVKALARAFRWKRMLESGEFATIGELAELAEREVIAPSYMTRVLRLTLLAPYLVEAILDGTQGPEVTLAGLMRGMLPEWTWQPGQWRRRTDLTAGEDADTSRPGSEESWTPPKTAFAALVRVSAGMFQVRRRVSGRPIGTRMGPGTAVGDARPPARGHAGRLRLSSQHHRFML